MTTPAYIPGVTTHARRGGITNAFRYTVDFVLIDPAEHAGPLLFSRNRMNLFSIRDRDHGGVRGDGEGVAWAQRVFEENGLYPSPKLKIYLLAQPRFFGFWFNPVSFWLAMEGDELRGVIAEVNNTFGDRHSYLCHKDDFAPITGQDRLTARKIFHVSPFQDVSGDYVFRFDIRPEKIGVGINLIDGNGGLISTLSGPRRPLTNGALARSAVRRPTGAFRTVVLIYWQALKLKLKGARYRKRPAPPQEEVT